jgi:hypothetical protein
MVPHDKVQKYAPLQQLNLRGQFRPDAAKPHKKTNSIVSLNNNSGVTQLATQNARNSRH